MAMLPRTTVVCTEFGRSTRKTRFDAAGFGFAGRTSVSSVFFQEESHFSSLGTSSEAFTSPTTPRIVFWGAYRLACHFASISDVIASIDSFVAATTAAG